MSQCSICLSGFKHPVSLPCGHVYCKVCLTNYINNAPQNREMNATCPHCRVAFHLTIPDLSLLPTKYHPFIVPAVRRVYVDNGNQGALEDRVKTLENRLIHKTAMENSLMDRYEALRATVDAHRQGERDANFRIMELEQDLQEMQEEHKAQLLRLRAEKAELILDNIGLKNLNGTLDMRVEHTHAALNEEKRTRIDLQNQLARLKNGTPPFQPSTHASLASTGSRASRVGPDDDEPVRMSNSSQDRTIPSSSWLLSAPQASSSSCRRPVKPLPKRCLVRDSSEMSPDAFSTKRMRAYDCDRSFDNLDVNSFNGDSD